MANKRHKDTGKIGWCDGKTLGLSRGHFVYIRKIRKVGNTYKCDVNTFTSLQNINGVYKVNKMSDIKDGNLYPIPIKDLSLPRFSAIHSNVIKNIDLKNINYVGVNKLKSRHKYYINKYMKTKN